MADDNTIIEGNVKFREGKKWKSRWCVMRRLSPVADSVQLEVWSDAGARRAGACKAALSLERALGVQTGFTLDRHSHTLALVCADLVAVLAFESRERLMQWHVKARAALGAGRQHTIVVAARSGRLPAGPACLLLRDGRFALTAGVPPRLLGVWELRHLRRYGVVDGRFCFEGGSLCGRGEGLHVLVTDRAADVARDFELAARDRLEPTRRNTLSRENGESAEEGKNEAQFTDGGETSRAALALDLADTASLCGARAETVGLARCLSCMSKLGALSRSSTAALTPGARHFSPAWTMDALPPAPPRPPKPPALSPAAPRDSCDCRTLVSGDERSTPSVGPFENYDVPKTTFTEIDEENYDTPKRLKECIESDLFRITKNCSADEMILKKQCGCLLRFGRRRREPMVIDVDENFQSPGCPCRRVTDWANDWIKFPYCKRKSTEERTETPTGDPSALYATVDVSRKSRRRTPDDCSKSLDPRRVEIDKGPLANYENLNFALSLEHYENARDMLRRAGVTQAELDALGATLRRGTRAGDYLLMRPEPGVCTTAPPAGYTPMSPVGSFAFHTLRRRPLGCTQALGDHKSASNPALGDALSPSGLPPALSGVPRRRRSNSADSSRFLEDVVEFEGGSSSSLETLRAGGDASRTVTVAPTNRDSSSSADSGVSSCSLRAMGGPPRDFEMPVTTSAARRQWAGVRRMENGEDAGAARRSRSAGAVCGPHGDPHCPQPAAKSSSAEAEVPLLRLLRGVRGAGDCGSWSSGASDMSDYIETLSLCSSHSSTDTPITLRWLPAPLRVRPRSAAEYRPVTSRSAARGPAPPGPAPREDAS